MNAAVGSKIVVASHHEGGHDRIGIIREVRGTDGSPPYVVEWLDAAGEHMVWPGPDAHIEQFKHIEHATPASPAGVD